MKLSAAILKGMERFPKKAVGQNFSADEKGACALGCALWAIGGDDALFSCAARAKARNETYEAELRFQREYSIGVSQANDHGIPREDIAGMLMAIGE